MSKIKDIFSIYYDAADFLEPFCLEDAELNDPAELADDSSKAKLTQWELETSKHFEDKNFLKKENFLCRLRL